MNRRQRPTPSVKEESFGEFLEPSTSRIPETRSASGNEDEMETDSEQFCYVEVALEDEDSDALNRMNETSINSTLNGIPEGAQGGPAKQITHEEASDDRPAKRRRNKRSLIWRHYEQLDCLGAARCRICLKKLQYFEGGSTSNLHRHMSKRHPEMFSQLIADGQPPPPPPRASQSSNANGHKATAPESITATERQRPFSGVLKVPRASEAERRAFRREMELIEALRRAQREEARALEHQRELLEKLRAVNAREAAAEREEIESLRNAQLEEARDLSRQREEVQKEKAELQKRWDEFQQEREELVLFSKGQQAS